MKKRRRLLTSCLAYAALLLATARSRAEVDVSPGGQGPDASWYDESFIHAHMSVGFHKLRTSTWPDMQSLPGPGRGRPPRRDPVSRRRRKGRELVTRVSVPTRRNTSTTRARGAPTTRTPRISFSIALPRTGSSLADGSNGGQMRKHLCFNSPGIDQRIVHPGSIARVAKRENPGADLDRREYHHRKPLLVPALPTRLQAAIRVRRAGKGRRSRLGGVRPVSPRNVRALAEEDLRRRPRRQPGNARHLQPLLLALAAGDAAGVRPQPLGRHPPQYARHGGLRALWLGDPDAL